MTSLFKNNYKVYLYKYNYAALQKKVSSLIDNNSANKFLFESFVTDLYTIGVPSDTVIDQISGKYKEYVDDYYKKQSTLSTKDKNTNKQIGESKTLEYKPLGKEDTDVLLKYSRSTISGEDNLVQRALAQNYALQMLQRDYENSMMKSGEEEIKINWLNTMEKKETYDNYVKKALELSTKLLENLFNPVIDDIKKLQQGEITNSEYVHVIDLTNLNSSAQLETVSTERTKYTSNNFIALNTERDGTSGETDTGDNAVDSIGVITTTLEGLSNMTSFNLRQDILLKYNISIEANDIIEIVNISQNKVLSKSLSGVQVANNEVNRNTQFIGFVTKLNLSQRFGGVSLLNVSCEGISKMLSLNPTISNNAVAPQFYSVIDFIAGKDAVQKTSNAAVTNVFSSFFDGLNAFDLFTKLLSDVLAVSPVEEDKTSYVLRLISDPDKLKSLPYQYAKPLIILYHFAVSKSTIRETGVKSHIVLAKIENNVNQEKLQAYLLMIRSQFDLFWSTMTTPISVLQTLANNTFLEIFEDRNGILILRPPRYNTWIDNDIIEPDNFIEWTQSVDDSTLKSRSDYQWSIPAIGVQNEFCGGYYQDIPALLKYGFRIDSPKNSPSVQSEIDAAVYSALDVTKANSDTRTFELTVPLTQDYVLGRLYYFPINKSIYGNIKSTGFVGYLSTISTTISPGNVDIHRLTFKYMRIAELIDSNDVAGDLKDKISLGDKSGFSILNFKRLPELSMYQSSVTPDMLTKKQRERLDEKVNQLCANSRYYWAAYYDPFKKKFDEWTKRNTYRTESEYLKLYFYLAPTNIRVKDFKSYENEKYLVKSSEFTPKQQLINALWFTDLLMRTNQPTNKYPIKAREIRTKTNEIYFFDYLRRDATFKEMYQPIQYIKVGNTNALSAPYATVHNQFFINDSLYPNMLSGFNSKEKENFENIMNNIMHIYTKYLRDDYNREEYEYWYRDNVSKKLLNARGIGRSNSDFKIAFDNHRKRLDIMAGAYENYCNNRFAFHEFEVAYDLAGNDIKTLLEYADVKDGQSFWEKQVKLVIKTSVDVFGIFTVLNNWISKLASSIGESLEVDSKVGIPAYIVQDTARFPLMQSLYKRGAYIAGVCPIDYTLEIHDFNKSIIAPNLGVTDKVKLNSMELKTAKSEVIGTFKKLILDTKLFNNGNGLLYYYPVIEFDNEKVKSCYGIDVTTLKNTYITTEEEINEFISNGKHTKFLPCVIRVGCTQIPEAKIPTIQQIYNQDGLYVGVDKNDDGSLVVNDTKAVFDPSVLYTWENSDFQDLYNVTVYNLIESINGNNFGTYLQCNERLETELNLKSNDIDWSSKVGKVTLDNITYFTELNKLPCVYNLELRCNLDKSTVINEMTQDAIKDRFKQCVLKTVFNIGDFPENGYLYIQDNSDYVNIVSENTKNFRDYALVCRLNLDFVKDDSIGVLTVTEADDVSANSAESSYTIDVELNSRKTDFIHSVELKEQTQVALYNSDFSYMPLTSKKLYPHDVYARLTEDKFGSLNPSTTFKPDSSELKILVQRYIREPNRTIGKLFINGQYFCDTLEDYDRGNITSKSQKVSGKTAINSGKYKIISSYSSKFNEDLPLLQNVPFFEGIRIHTGLTEDDTEGCILVGTYKDGVWYSSDSSVNKLNSELNTNSTITIERLYSV